MRMAMRGEGGLTLPLLTHERDRLAVYLNGTRVQRKESSLLAQETDHRAEQEETNQRRIHVTLRLNKNLTPSSDAVARDLRHTQQYLPVLRVQKAVAGGCNQCRWNRAPENFHVGIPRRYQLPRCEFRESDFARDSEAVDFIEIARELARLTPAAPGSWEPLVRLCAFRGRTARPIAHR